MNQSQDHYAETNSERREVSSGQEGWSLDIPTPPLPRCLLSWRLSSQILCMFQEHKMDKKLKKRWDGEDP